MLLGRRGHGAGNSIRYRINYANFLEEGVSLTSGTVVLDPASTVADVTITAVTVTPSNKLVFLLSGGSLNEVFTLNIQAVDSVGEIKNDTIEFFITP